MDRYYAMLTPGQCGDWGNIILIDARVYDFLDKASYRDYNVERFKEYFTQETRDFLQKEFNSLEKDEKSFLKHISQTWEQITSESYYDLKELKSTLTFGGVSGVVKYAIDNNVAVIGDLY